MDKQDVSLDPLRLDLRMCAYVCIGQCVDMWADIFLVHIPPQSPAGACACTNLLVGESAEDGPVILEVGVVLKQDDDLMHI